MKRLYIHIGAIAVITLLAFWLRFANLGSLNLYNDEYLQFETAAGVVESDQYRQYNFYTQELEESYTRAKLYTWQIAQSFSVFGYSEMAARLPAVLWGSLLVPAVIIVVLGLMKNPWVAYSSGLLITFDNFFIEMSRFTRMYSMVFVLTVIIIALTYLCFQAQSRKSRMVFGGLAAIVWCIDLLTFKELALALAVGISVYVALRAGYYLCRPDKFRLDTQDKFLAWLFIIGSGMSIVGAVIHFAGWHFIPVDAFIYRDVPHFYYLYEVFSELHIPEFGLFFLLFGVIAIRSGRSFESLLACVGIFLLIYFVYFSHRWEAKRYIGFVLPMLYIVISLGIVRTFKLIGSLAHVSQASRIIIGIIGFFLVGPWLSFPGVPSDHFMVQTAYADYEYKDVKRANVQKAYQYVADHYSPGETVFIQDPRYYYWPDRSIPLVELGKYKSLAFEDFVSMIQAADHGGWVVYNATKTRHLEKKIRQYSANRFEYIYQLDNTLVFVFHFTPDDIKN